MVGKFLVGPTLNMAATLPATSSASETTELKVTGRQMILLLYGPYSTRSAYAIFAFACDASLTFPDLSFLDAK